MSPACLVQVRFRTRDEHHDGFGLCCVAHMVQLLSTCSGSRLPVVRWPAHPDGASFFGAHQVFWSLLLGYDSHVDTCCRVRPNGRLRHLFFGMMCIAFSTGHFATRSTYLPQRAWTEYQTKPQSMFWPAEGLQGEVWLDEEVVILHLLALGAAVDTYSLAQAGCCCSRAPLSLLTI